MSGSSPHTRGAPGRKDPGGRRVGIIPAYAGSTLLVNCRRQRERDHPRIRGEHNSFAWVLYSLPGSSPHTRGALSFIVASFAHVGIIPAYAGSTHIRWLPIKEQRDHPRIRGEHYKQMKKAGYREGSSPHTRGALFLSFFWPVPVGIIPAYAGSTFKNASTRLLARDHPRIRGEHAKHVRLFGQAQGSSPHTRGARRIIEPLVFTHGIIPAYAGST